MSELSDIISAAGSIIGGIAAAVGLFYVAFQFKNTAKQTYYTTLTDIAGKIEDLESSSERNTDHRTFSMKYLNLLERIATFAVNGLIDKAIARYFKNMFGEALGLLKMGEYTDASTYFNYLMSWCRIEGISPSRPPLPSPNIHIIPVKGKASPNEAVLRPSKFSPNVHHATLGDFVTWINEDTSPHTVTSGTSQDSNAGRIFDSPQSGVLALTKNGEMFSHEFNEPGEFPYFCRIHPAEVGVVIVADGTKVDHSAVKAPVLQVVPNEQNNMISNPKVEHVAIGTPLLEINKVPTIGDICNRTYQFA